MSKNTLYPLLIIILLGAILRLWGLSSAELVFDEGAYAFRSIGYLDYLESHEQPTPVQWLRDGRLPAWLKLSFHDHPPLFFLIQHWFFALLGDSLTIARLPSALAGSIAIFLFFLIGRELFKKFNLGEKEIFKGVSASDFGGLLTAGLTALSFSPLMISRLSMLESVAFLFILLNIYLFLRLLINPKYWMAFGLTLGLAFLSKYVSFFLVLTYLTFLIFIKSPLLRSRYLYLAVLLAVLIFSPVIIYNILLYQNFGHFDLQFATLFSQEVPYWQGSSGKTQEPFSNILENLLILYSIPFLILVVGGIILTIFGKKILPGNWLETRPSLLFMFLNLIFITVLLMVIGSAIRFSSLYIIPAAFFVALIFIMALNRLPKIKTAILIIFLIFLAQETVFALQPLFLNAPNYGVRELDEYFDSVFGKARGPGLPAHPNPHLNRIIQKYAAKREATLPPTGIIYDDNLETAPILWLFSRRQYYQGVPITTASNFEATLGDQGATFFKDLKLYFVKAGPGAPPRRGTREPAPERLEMFLRESELEPEIIIKDFAGEIAFKIYQFSL